MPKAVATIHGNDKRTRDQNCERRGARGFIAVAVREGEGISLS
jgi:hypothetical protein